MRNIETSLDQFIRLDNASRDRTLSDGTKIRGRALTAVESNKLASLLQVREVRAYMEKQAATRKAKRNG